MSQSLAKVYVHLIFSTKNRERFLREDIRPDLHAYVGGILRDLDSPCIEINREPDHAHLLFILSHPYDQRRSGTGEARLFCMAKDEGQLLFSISRAEWVWSFLCEPVRSGRGQRIYSMSKGTSQTFELSG